MCNGMLFALYWKTIHPAAVVRFNCNFYQFRALHLASTLPSFQETVSKALNNDQRCGASNSSGGVTAEKHLAGLPDYF